MIPRFLFACMVIAFAQADDPPKTSKASEIVAAASNNVTTPVDGPKPVVLPCFSSRNCEDPGMVCKYVNGTEGASNSTGDGATSVAALSATLQENPDPKSPDNFEAFDSADIKEARGACVCDSKRRTSCSLDVDCKAVFNSEIPCLPSKLCPASTGTSTGYCRKASLATTPNISFPTTLPSA